MTRVRGELLFLLLLFWKPGEPSWQAVWEERWGIVAAVLGLMWIWRIRFRRPCFRFLLSYLWVMGILSIFLEGFHPWEKTLILMMRQNAGEQILSLTAFLIFLTVRFDAKRLLFYSAWIVLAGIVFSHSPRYETAIMRNPTMSATFVVLASGVHPFSLVSVAITHSYTAFFSWLAGTAYRWLAR